MATDLVRHMHLQTGCGTCTGTCRCAWVVAQDVGVGGGGGDFFACLTTQTYVKQLAAVRHGYLATIQLARLGLPGQTLLLHNSAHVPHDSPVELAVLLSATVVLPDSIVTFISSTVCAVAGTRHSSANRATAARAQRAMACSY